MTDHNPDCTSSTAEMFLIEPKDWVDCGHDIKQLLTLTLKQQMRNHTQDTIYTHKVTTDEEKSSFAFTQ